MLFLQSRTWTRGQRCFIVGAVVAGLVVFSALVYSYERYYRGPRDTVFVGTWEVVTWRHPAIIEPDDRPFSVYYEFKSDHTYREFAIAPEVSPHHRDVLETGTWYAGGDFLYLRPPLDQASHMGLFPFHIDAMSSNEVKLHIGRASVVLKRVVPDSPTASNQSLELTATRHAATLPDD